MPRAIIKLVRLTVGILSGGLTCGEAKSTQLQWDRLQVFAPASMGQSVVTSRFGFKNTSAAPVEITSVEPTCDCTQATSSRSIVPPGETGEIVAIFTPGKSVGLQEKSIVVTTSSSDVERVVLWLRTEIPPVASITPSELKWGPAAHGEKRIFVVSNIGRPIKVTLGKLSPRTIDAHCESSAGGMSHTIHLRRSENSRSGKSVMLLEVSGGDVVQNYLVTVFLE